VRAVESAGPSAVSFRQVVSVLRRRYVLILTATILGAGEMFLASQAPVYQASAMLRLAGDGRP
jgi:uncharacterized protein involved in exopolysaccharide biosynthesis